MNLLIISVPLLSSIIILLFGRYIGHKGGKIISISSITLSVILSFISFNNFLKGKYSVIKIKDWFEIGELKGHIDLIYDKESILMINLISIITWVVIIYSYWYLAKEAHLNRFISKILIFSVSMFILVTSKNYLFSFFGWEGVGIISYLLINFWSIPIQNNKSAIKAIIFNKIGDIFYILGLLLLAFFISSFDYQYISFYVGYTPSMAISVISICFIIAAMAKSAQILLHCWLGDAMAGPTPVSALLHAATMVTAGIFILIRSNVILNSHPTGVLPCKNIIVIIGTLTIIFAGISSLNQNDIKKIIAYSTCAQIGFMFFALGLYQKPIYGSLYHLITHGFFKALLFLSAGLLIHSYLLEQDLRKYGNFIFSAPLYYIFFFIGSLAIIGFPTFSGFFSKDLILLHSLIHPIYSYIILILGSILSSFYSFKILYYSFFGSSTYSISAILSFHFLTSYTFLLPFIFLILGSIFLGYTSSNIFTSPEDVNIDLEYSFADLFFIKLIPLLLPFITIIILLFYYRWGGILPFTNNNILYYCFYKLQSFFNRKFLFDSFYNYYILKPLFLISYHFFYKFIDRGYLEYLGPLSLFRLFFFFPSSYNLSNQLSSNLPYLFFYFFSSIIIVLIYFYYNIPI